MNPQIVRNFMKQQGFPDEAAPVCNMHFAGLNFQPRIVGSLVIVAIILGSPILFLILSAMLWWNVVVPALNPFELVYNRLIASPRGKSMLVPAPAPRRFAQAMAATMMLIIAFALLQRWTVTAWFFEAFVIVAFSMLLFGRFCFGAYIYHLLRGKVSFANATLPWARSR